jgi:hypothetical protein
MAELNVAYEEARLELGLRRHQRPASAAFLGRRRRRLSVRVSGDDSGHRLVVCLIREDPGPRRRKGRANVTKISGAGNC